MSLHIRPALTSDATAILDLHIRARAISSPERGVSVGRLWAWEFNERAGRFYRRLGWQTDGTYRPDDPRVGEHRMIGYRLDVPAVCAVR